MFKCCNEGHSPSSHFDLKWQNFCILIKNFLTTFTAQFAGSLRFLYNIFHFVSLSLSLPPALSSPAHCARTHLLQLVLFALFQNSFLHVVKI